MPEEFSAINNRLIKKNSYSFCIYISIYFYRYYFALNAPRKACIYLCIYISGTIPYVYTFIYTFTYFQSPVALAFQSICHHPCGMQHEEPEIVKYF